MTTEAKEPETELLGADLIILYALHDALLNTYRLCRALLRYIVMPSGGYEMPALAAWSPLVDQHENLAAENITHEEIETSIRSTRPDASPS